jgi:hypothetical protein
MSTVHYTMREVVNAVLDLSNVSIGQVLSPDRPAWLCQIRTVIVGCVVTLTRPRAVVDLCPVIGKAHNSVFLALERWRAMDALDREIWLHRVEQRIGKRPPVIEWRYEPPVQELLPNQMREVA